MSTTLPSMLEGLNDRQLEAICETVDQSALVLSGAGAGKTTVLARRIAYLIDQCGKQPFNILAVTFTNKASNEMKERVAKLIGKDKAKLLTMGTFHKICILMLRKYGQAIGVDANFTIALPNDQQQVMRQILANHGLETKAANIRRFLSLISDLKNKLYTPNAYYQVLQGQTASGSEEYFIHKVYDAYQATIEKFNMLDFDDMIMKAVRLLQKDQTTRRYYQERFHYVMADEYQDTNPAQYLLLRLISAKAQPEIQDKNNIFVVGDADQCQPPETLVSTPNGEKQISELKTGDHVLSWNRNAQYATNVGYPIQVAERDYSGNMFTIEAGEKETKATPNHKFIARWSSRSTDIWVTYLMYRSDLGYRIGWCQLFNNEKSLHLNIRARLEKAEKTWVLAVHDSKKKATAHESIMSIKFGIPLITFEPNGELYDQETIADIFREARIDAGKECLTYHALHEEYPFLPYADYKKYQHRPTYFEIYACNLLPDLMAIPLPSSKKDRNQWITIDGVIVNQYDGPVYSLDVAEHHNYIADGLVTLNSIYSFRGSDMNIILDFEKDFPDARVVKLEQNYRSTQNVVNASNAMILNNEMRKERTSFTVNKEGTPIKVSAHMKGESEANFIAKEIKQLIAKGYQHKDIAILYRTNFLSRELESHMIQYRIPYTIVGGTSFYDRKEIRDIVCYMKVVVNPRDDMSMKRVLEISPGIGKTTVNKIEEQAASLQLSMVESLKHFKVKRKATQDAVDTVRELLRDLHSIYRVAKKDQNAKDPVTTFMNITWKRTAYREKLKEINDKESFNRLENLDEFYRVAEMYDTEMKHPMIDDFLDGIILQTERDKEEDKTDTVSLMTIHASKGLEYPVIFVVGMEEGILPHKNSLGSDADIEEERRLAYVAMTRAEQELYLSYAQARKSYQGPEYNAPSRFLEELPKEVIQTL